LIVLRTAGKRGAELRGDDGEDHRGRMLDEEQALRKGGGDACSNQRRDAVEHDPGEQLAVHPDGEEASGTTLRGTPARARGNAANHEHERVRAAKHDDPAKQVVKSFEEQVESVHVPRVPRAVGGRLTAMNQDGDHAVGAVGGAVLDVIDVVVLGGGVAGASAARALAMAGREVLLLEAGGNSADDALPGTTSSLPVALLNPWRGRKGDAHPADLRGLAVTWRWAADLRAEGWDPGAKAQGVVRIATNARQAQAWEQRARTTDTLTWVPAAEVPAALHAPFGALRVEHGGRIDPRRWRAALLASARMHGARVHTGTTVTRIESLAVGGWRLHAKGAVGSVAARTVIAAFGASTPPHLRHDGRTVEWPTWERTRGDLVHLVGVCELPHPVAGGLYAGTDAEGRVWVGGGHRPADVADEEAPRKLREAFAWAFPAAASAQLGATWSGVRAKRPGARPEVREVAPGVWVFGAFAGRGFLCAADEAERLAQVRLRCATTE